MAEENCSSCVEVRAGTRHLCSIHGRAAVGPVAQPPIVETALHDEMERDAMIDTIKALEAEINAAWLSIECGWDIEPRSFFETEAPENGFGSPLAMAVHYMWKRETKSVHTATNPHPQKLIETSKGVSSNVQNIFTHPRNPKRAIQLPTFKHSEAGTASKD